MFRVIVCGTKTFISKEFIFERLDGYLVNYSKKSIEIVEGECEGPDKISAMWAAKNKVKVTKFFAQWKKYGKSAGPRRNTEMANYCDPGDGCVAFWDGKSPGTKDMIEKAKARGLNVKIIITPKITNS